MNDLALEEKRKNHTPFYYYKGKWFCFLNYDPKTREIYISFVKGNQVLHPKLLSEGRKQMKIYRIDPEKTIHIKELTTICNKLKKIYH